MSQKILKQMDPLFIIKNGTAVPFSAGCLSSRRAIRIAVSKTVGLILSDRRNSAISVASNTSISRALLHLVNEASNFGGCLHSFGALLEQWYDRNDSRQSQFRKLEYHLRRKRVFRSACQSTDSLLKLIAVIQFGKMLAALRFFESAISDELSVDDAAPLHRFSDEIQTKQVMQPPCPWTTDDPPLELGINRSFFGLNSVFPEDLRNVLVLGETGSGKTVSAVMPYLHAALCYKLRSGIPGTVFVADPKLELRTVCESVLKKAGELDRLVVLGDNSPPVRIFPLDCTLSMPDRRKRIDAILPFEDFDTGSHSYWNENSMIKIYALLSLQYEVAKNVPGTRLLTEWARALGIGTRSRNSWVALKSILEHLCKGGSGGLKKGLMPLRDLCNQYGLVGSDIDTFEMYTSGEDSFMQFMYVVTCAAPLLGLLADPCMLRYADIDPVPDPESHTINVSDMVNAGKVIVIQPENTESARIAVRAVKGKVHEAVFTRENRESPVFTVVDEFQRFISNDTETGEQAFLDRCRGYRGMALYATQTLASLSHALGSNNTARTAVDIILANTPTKIVMRTTDESTLSWLRAVLPGPPRPGPHIVDVHRPVELQQGQGYLIQANGSWALRQASPSPVFNA